ncbi:MAG: hypothetical protein LBF60_03835 [Treponema sp.]|nr:hypothetical protein [Treponema sp.]
MAKKYWVTMQWPHDRDALEEPHKNIYAVIGKRHVLSGIQEGDIVFIYETKHGKRPDRSPPLQIDGCQSYARIPEHIWDIYGYENMNATNGTERISLFRL